MTVMVKTAYGIEFLDDRLGSRSVSTQSAAIPIPHSSFSIPMKRRHFLQATSTAVIVNALPSLQPIATPAQFPARKFALLIGINDYSQGKGMAISNLKGCVNDVLLLKKLLHYRYGFEDQDIITLTNAQASRENILKQFENHILNQAGPNDIVVIGFSGHGSPLQDPTNPNQMTTGFVPHNFNVNSNGVSNFITGTTFFLLRSALKTNKATFIFDCCYAENIKRTDGLVRSTGITIGAAISKPSPEEKDYQQRIMRQLNLNAATLNQNRQNQKGTKGILLAAAAENQLALDSPLTETLNAGAYTKFLTEILWSDPETSFESVAQSVSIRLAQSSKNAQQPAIIYANESRPSLSQPSFFMSASDRSLDRTIKIRTQGVIEAVNANKREVTLWLGGCSSQSLNMPPGSKFKLINAKNTNTEETIVTLTSNIRSDFTVIATIPADRPLPTVGTLVQKYYRAIPKDFQLLLELDESLGQTFIFPSNFARIKSIRRINDTSNADLVFSKMTPEYYKLQEKPISERPAIGSYGLFTNEMFYKSGTFGATNETVEAAVDRLRPQIKSELIKKFLKKMLLNEQELPPFPGLSAYLRLKEQPQTIIATPDQVKRSIVPNTEVEIVLNNPTSEKLELVLIGISPIGKLTISENTITVMPKSEYRSAFSVSLEDGVGIGEILLVLGNNLAEINEQISDLIKELNTSRSRTNDSKQTTLASSFNHLVISLPIEMRAS